MKYVWIAMLLCCAPCLAEEFVQSSVSDGIAAKSLDEADQLWLNGGLVSHHFWRHGQYNEKNWGTGLEYKFRSDFSAVTGFYRNSVRHRTEYGALTWLPLSLGALRVGGMVGLMNGYPAKSGGRWFFVALPVVSIEGERFGANIVVIPSVGRIEGSVALQLKFRAR